MYKGDDGDDVPGSSRDDLSWFREVLVGHRVSGLS